MNRIVRITPVSYPAVSSDLHAEIVSLTTCTNARSFARLSRADEPQTDTVWTLTTSLSESLDRAIKGGAR
jgi:hypothetical protein